MDRSSGVVTTVEEPEGFAVSEGGQNVLFYRTVSRPDADGHARPHYIHPLFGLDGEVLTEESPPDHRHQFGVYWAWHQVWIANTRIGDAWIQKDFEWDVQDVVSSVGEGGSAALDGVVIWKSPLWIDKLGAQLPIVRETFATEIHPAGEGLRRIDFRIELLALEEGVRIGGSEDDKGYGGFSVRTRLPEGLRFTGRDGEIEPTRPPVDAGPWVDWSGPLGEQGEVSGIAVLCHPTSAGFPQPWILRRNGSMQNPVYPGPEPVPVSCEEATLLRYSLIVHRGSAEDVDLEGINAEYSAEG